MTIKLAIFLFLILFIAYYGFKKLATTYKFQLFGDLITHVNTNKKFVALTYDDGPNPPYTNQILDILTRFQVKATFFVVGKNIEQHPETTQRMISLGHELGNHSFSHEKMISKNMFFIKSEIKKTDQLLRQLGIRSKIHFRAPFGLKRVRLPLALAQMGKKNVLWNLDPKDYAASNSESIVDHVINQITPGSIILLHDGGGERAITVAATETLIQKLQQKGYQFKTISELIDV